MGNRRCLSFTNFKRPNSSLGMETLILLFFILFFDSWGGLGRNTFLSQRSSEETRVQRFLSLRLVWSRRYVLLTPRVARGPWATTGRDSSCLWHLSAPSVQAALLPHPSSGARTPSGPHPFSEIQMPEEAPGDLSTSSRVPLIGDPITNSWECRDHQSIHGPLSKL